MIRGLSPKERDTEAGKIALRARGPRKVDSPVEQTAALRPFFGYYGGKWRDALRHYPSPQFTTIVEPFAGSAGYSLRHHHLKVILCEIDPALAEVWRYLKRVTQREILELPDLPVDKTVDDLRVPQEAKWLIGLWLNRGVAAPRKRASLWMRQGIRPGCFWGEKVRARIAAQVTKIRHWKVYNRSYTDCPLPSRATWFIDPPYERAGRHYRFGADLIDYSALGAWCKALSGQVIVCENAGASWLPFRDLASVKTTRSEQLSKEVYWSNAFDSERLRVSIHAIARGKR
jgi:site-specific DNA-adenine methylase